MVLKAGSPRSRCLHGWVLRRALFLVGRQGLPAMSSRGLVTADEESEHSACLPLLVGN